MFNKMKTLPIELLQECISFVPTIDKPKVSRAFREIRQAYQDWLRINTMKAGDSLENIVDLCEENTIKIAFMNYKAFPNFDINRICALSVIREQRWLIGLCVRNQSNLRIPVNEQYHDFYEDLEEMGHYDLLIKSSVINGNEYVACTTCVKQGCLKSLQDLIRKEFYSDREMFEDVAISAIDCENLPILEWLVIEKGVYTEEIKDFAVMNGNMDIIDFLIGGVASSTRQVQTWYNIANSRQVKEYIENIEYPEDDYDY
jgi:hypothetical protein